MIINGKSYLFLQNTNLYYPIVKIQPTDWKSKNENSTYSCILLEFDLNCTGLASVPSDFIEKSHGSNKDSSANDVNVEQREGLKNASIMLPTVETT